MISVIIPTYNRATFLPRAIDSVLAQTEKDYEVIVVDDGSTDNTPDVLKKYAGVVQIVRKPNGGCASARNEGLKRARGEYIAFLDSDDFWEPTKLAIQIRIMDSNPEVGMICSDFSYYEGDRCLTNSYISTYCPVFNMLGKKFYDFFDSKDEMSHEGISHSFYKGNVFKLELLGYFTLTSTVMIRRKCLDVVGIFDTSYKFSSDYELFLRFSFFHPICYLSTPTIRFGRFHSGQLSSPENAYDQMRSGLRINLEIEKKFPEFFLRNKEVLNWSRAINFFAIGVPSYRMGKYSESIWNFKQCIRHNPWSKRAYIYLVQSYVRRLLQSNKIDSQESRIVD